MSLSSQVPNNGGQLLGHPKGLFLLFGTEMWERFGYYGMRGLLILYLVATVENGGFGWSNSDALSLYGTFTMAVYLTPLLGGWLADNVLGQRRCIIIGGLTMAAGHFMLGTPHAWIPGLEETFFYIGLVFICLGNGLFKPNISTLVGDLYQEGDHRRDGAFTIFYMGINVGAFLGPMITGAVSQGGQWNYGFIAAGIGMVISVVMQVTYAQKLLGDIGRVPSAKQSKDDNHAAKDQPLTKEERDRTKVILIMSVFSIIFWMGYEQAGGLFNLYAQNFTDRVIWGYEVPAAWLQSISALFIIVLAPMFASLWVSMGDREPTSPVKFSLAMLFLSLGFLSMVGAALMQGGDPNVKVSMAWLVLAYLCHVLGELCLSPIGLSLVSKLAPLKFTSILMGAWFLCSAIANKLAAVIGGFIGDGDSQAENTLAIFSGMTITGLIAAVIIYLLADKLVDWMHGAEQPEKVAHEFEHKLEEELEVTEQHEGNDPKL